MSAPNPVTPSALHWWLVFQRFDVLAALEDATGEPLSANDPLPDTLIANAQALGLVPSELRIWIYDEPKRPDWTAGALEEFARHYGLGRFSGRERAEA
jgi:hypothetical protein